MSRKAVEWARANCGMYSTIGSNITIEALSLERLIDQLTAAQQRVAELESVYQWVCDEEFAAYVKAFKSKGTTKAMHNQYREAMRRVAERMRKGELLALLRTPELQATLTAVRTELATLQASHSKNVELLAHATEKAVELTSENERLRELLRELCKSFECYAALNKPEKDWDEYDHMMNPVWQRANKELGQ